MTACKTVSQPSQYHNSNVPRHGIVTLYGYPIEVLVERGLPFVFATGYGQRGVPEPYRRTPTLQKPFQAEALAQALEAATPRRGRN